MNTPAENSAILPSIHDSENSHAEKSLTNAELLAMIDALTPEDQRRLEVVLQGALSGKLPEG